MDALNNEFDNVRIGKIDVSNMVVDRKNHFYFLQVGYVKMMVNKYNMKKL